MDYSKELPQLSDLCSIARAVESFPATASQLANAAKSLGYSSEIVGFVRQFSISDREEVFQTRADFYIRAAELTMLICEEQVQQAESLTKP